jgi:hypothetical protein
MTSVNELYGTWRLVSCKSTIVETGESEETFGKAPSGFIHYGPDDRMMVLVVRDERPRPPAIAAMTAEMRAELLKTMVAYAGTFSFDGKTVIHHIDVSWNELWTGTNQLRNIQIEGRRLRISTNPEPHPGNGKMAVSVLVWEKVE